MKLEGLCRTTAMGILPHTDVEAALRLAMSLDIPFWPQLPKVSFYEDMYAQASENFPGITLDAANQRLSFDTARFYEQLLEYAEAAIDQSTFDISERYSAVFSRFLQQDLSRYPAIRGQTIGPISFGLKVCDEDLKPIIYNPDVRTIIFEFLQQKVNRQLEGLRRKNENAFVWVDEPGLAFIFSGLSGYTSEVAQEDLRGFMAGVQGLRGVHLCANIDWDFLLSADIDILSFDCYALGLIFSRYTDAIRAFLKRGGIISWGLVPAKTEDFSQESLHSLADHIEDLWSHLAQRGIDKELIVRNALLAPATCSLVNPDHTETVDRSFATLREVSALLRRRYGLDG